MDNKNYILLNDGSLALERSEWNADNEKLACNIDGTIKPNGTTLKIFTNGKYEEGCDYAFACGGHWYLF